MTSINLSSFTFDSVNMSVIVEALEHIKNYLEDTEYNEYFCDLANESLGCDPYVIYHASAKAWIKKHDLCPFDMIEDIREYHTNNYEGFELEIHPENVVTAYMDVVLGDLIGCWLNCKLEEDYDLDLWNEEITDETRALIIQIINEELESLEV